MGTGVTSRYVAVVIALTRGWIGVYTRHTPQQLAEARRAEIESDIWAVPSWFFDGRREVANCAAAAPPPQTNTDFRLEVMRCAGAFFSSAR